MLKIEDVISLFPDGTCFQSDCEEYYDICNFLTSFSYKAKNEKWKAITPAKRRELVKSMRQKVSVLDELTKQHWGNSSEKDRWKEAFMKRTVAIDIQDFSTLREENCFYIDKTSLIKEWWERKDHTTLITRPCRVGKTLNFLGEKRRA